jgi:hypothetical protein
VTLYLVTYNRRTEEGRVLASFEDAASTDANTALRRAEASKEPYEEVVLLSAANRSTLEHTHARYFVKANDLTHV